jgi:isochorismate hydrolase
MEDPREAEIVKRILRFRDAIKNMETNVSLTAEAEAARDEVINVVNNFFYEKLTAIPEIRDYMNSFIEDD